MKQVLFLFKKTQNTKATNKTQKQQQTQTKQKKNKHKTKTNKTKQNKNNQNQNRRLFQLVLYVSLFTIHLFPFSLTGVLQHMSLPPQLRLNCHYFCWATVRKPFCISENYFHLHFYCSHLPSHTFPSYPFSSVFFINVSLLSVYIYHSSTFFFFRWPTFVFLISSRTFSQSIYLAIDVNQQSARVFVLLSFNVYVSPRPLYIARGKVLN